MSINIKEIEKATFGRKKYIISETTVDKLIFCIDEEQDLDQKDRLINVLKELQKEVYNEANEVQASDE